jgi:predicted outer membrane protein
MARVLHGIEKGLRLFQENGNELIDILSGAAVPDGLLDQSDASIGSLYVRSGTGQLYQKIANAGNSSDWQLNGATSAVIGTWRPESVVVVTNAVQGAGTRDMVASPFSDDEGTIVPIGDYVVDKYVISDADGTPVLLRISAVSGDDVTFVVSGSALVANDTFVTKHYLPDSPAAQEGEAIVNFNGTVMIKIADVNWNFADGINMAAGYAPVNGTVTSADTVNSAIQKLDGNQIDLTTLSGVAQGAVDLGTFTGATIPDASTNKGAFQALETAHEEVDQNVNDLITLSGVAENSTDLGTFTGATIPDASTVKAALQSLETAHEEVDQNVNDLITLSGVAENATDLGTFTGATIPDASDVKEALQALETAHEEVDQNVNDLITLSGVAENATSFGTFTGVSLADNQTSKQLFQRIEVLLEQMRGVQVAAITAATTVDSVPHADVKACKWLVEAFEDATPANRKAFEIYALNNGTLVDDTSYSLLKVGANFNLTLSVDISGADMRLRAASSSAGVTVTARRIEVVKSIL